MASQLLYLRRESASKTRDMITLKIDPRHVSAHRRRTVQSTISGWRAFGPCFPCPIMAMPAKQSAFPSRIKLGILSDGGRRDASWYGGSQRHVHIASTCQKREIKCSHLLVNLMRSIARPSISARGPSQEKNVTWSNVTPVLPQVLLWYRAQDRALIALNRPYSRKKYHWASHTLVKRYLYRESNTAIDGQR